jgi:hypothetical protein
VVIVGVVAVSRLYLGAHWLTDVLGGLALGAAWLFALLTSVRLVDRAVVQALNHAAQPQPCACWPAGGWLVARVQDHGLRIALDRADARLGGHLPTDARLYRPTSIDTSSPATGAPPAPASTAKSRTSTANSTATSTSSSRPPTGPSWSSRSSPSCPSAPPTTTGSPPGASSATTACTTGGSSTPDRLGQGPADRPSHRRPGRLTTHLPSVRLSGAPAPGTRVSAALAGGRRGSRHSRSPAVSSMGQACGLAGTGVQGRWRGQIPCEVVAAIRSTGSFILSLMAQTCRLLTRPRPSRRC